MAYSAAFSAVGPSVATRHASRRTASTSGRTLGSTRGQLVRFDMRSSYLSGTPVLQQPITRCSSHQGGALGAQMNLFSRLFRVARSYGNQFVGNLEDPEKILETAVTDLQNDVIKMRQASAQVLASQKQLEAKYKQAKQTADDWYRRAQLAVEKGDDELAREALKRRKGYEENANTFKIQLDAQKKAVEQLIGNTRMLENKLAEAKSKKDTLKARAKSAQSAKQIQEMLQGLNNSNASVAFDKMEQKVMALEAESESVLQLSAGGDEVERKFAALEGDDVDNELSQMKKGMLKGGSGSRQSLPEGRPIRDAIDFELDELRKKARD